MGLSGPIICRFQNLTQQNLSQKTFSNLWWGPNWTNCDLRNHVVENCATARGSPSQMEQVWHLRPGSICESKKHVCRSKAQMFYFSSAEEIIVSSFLSPISCSLYDVLNNQEAWFQSAKCCFQRKWNGTLESCNHYNHSMDVNPGIEIHSLLIVTQTCSIRSCICFEDPMFAKLTHATCKIFRLKPSKIGKLEVPRLNMFSPLN